jgi:hypothetical protein
VALQQRFTKRVRFDYGKGNQHLDMSIPCPSSPSPKALGLLKVPQDAPLPSAFFPGGGAIRRMPDGLYELHGLGGGGNVHLKKEMRDWQLETQMDGATVYNTRRVEAAYEYAQNHGLTVRASALS